MEASKSRQWGGGYSRTMVSKRALLAVFCWLTLLLRASNTQDWPCIYSETLVPYTTYYIHNHEYPDNYSGHRRCQWSIQSPYRYKIHINCSLNMPWSLNCNADQLVIQTASNVWHTYCGKGTVDHVLDEPSATIQFRSPFTSEGGKFLCRATLVETPGDENCRCGRKNPSRIVGGTETGVNEFPMMCALVDLEIGEPFCGCTIIHDKYVVTAAHCLYNRALSNIVVLVGEHDYTTGNDTSASKLYGVKKGITHRNYDVVKGINDIAVIEVTERMHFDNRVGPVCLPFQHSADTFGGDRVTLLGWGLMEFGAMRPTMLRKVQMGVQTNLQCKKSYPTVNVDQICTYEEGKDSCTMDSGGPVLWEDPTSHNLVLVGVINHGVGCAIRGSVNARVGAYINWITSVTPDANYCTIE